MTRVGVRRMAAASAIVSMMAAAPMAAAADVELGRYLASECMTCHRGATATTTTIPNIFGRAEQELTRIIRAYRDRQLPNPVMQNVAGRLKDDEIAALAAYFATTPKP
jgi:cytochrome c553